MARESGAITKSIFPFTRWLRNAAGAEVIHRADRRGGLFGNGPPAAFHILTEPNPPVLSKVPETTPIAEAVEISSKALTVGEDRFKAADALLRHGKTNDAIASFERLRREFRQTWIDRISQERLAKLDPNRTESAPAAVDTTIGIAAKYSG